MDTHVVTAWLAPLPLTEEALCRWFGQAEPGSTLVYHRGSLAIDCARETSDLSEADRAELARVRARAMWAAEHGLAHLVQHRNEVDDYSYVAVARTRPSRPPSWRAGSLA